MGESELANGNVAWIERSGNPGQSCLLGCLLRIGIQATRAVYFDVYVAMRHDVIAPARIGLERSSGFSLTYNHGSSWPDQ